jgi:sugar O-acyltransferase (sialic acid O-acetyltransferase NeuD family)
LIMKKMAILGASGHGKVVAEIAELNGWEGIVFFDDAYPNIKQNGVWPVRGTTKDLIAAADEYSTVIVAIGDNQIRLQKSKFLLSEGLKLGSLIHPKAQVSKYAKIKEGTVVMAGAVINPFATVGMCSIINTSCSIDHDCVIGNGVHISPGAHLAGGVEVGDLSWLGIGSTVKQSIKIGCSATVAAGAVVVNDVPDGVVVKGVPAK